MISIFLLTWLAFSIPSYEMEIISDFNNFPTTGDVFKVPYKNDYLMCVSNDKRKSYSRPEMPINDIFKDYIQGCRGFRSDNHILIFCYNQTCKYDNTNIGNASQIVIENNSIIYKSIGGDECIENNVKTRYQLIAKLDCDAAIPKKLMVCPTFWKKGNCTVETVLKTSAACKHPIYKSKGFYNIKCIDRKIFKREMNRFEDN